MGTHIIPFDPTGPPVELTIVATGAVEVGYQVAFFPKAGERGHYLAENESTTGGRSRLIRIPEEPADLEGDYLVWWVLAFGPDVRAKYRIELTFQQGGKQLAILPPPTYEGTIESRPSGHVGDGRFLASAPA